MENGDCLHHELSMNDVNQMMIEAFKGQDSTNIRISTHIPGGVSGFRQPGTSRLANQPVYNQTRVYYYNIQTAKNQYKNSDTVPT